jgi:AbrB family looped-hinge helix DNA binding protein
MYPYCKAVRMGITKLTSKFQTTIPLEVRKFLKLEAGDSISFEIEDDKVVIKRLGKFDSEWHKALSSVLDEWNSKEDDDAYESL